MALGLQRLSKFMISLNEQTAIGLKIMANICKELILKIAKKLYANTAMSEGE